MSNSKNSKETLLLEIGTEELPPKALKTLGRTFGELVLAELQQAQLTELNVSTLRWFAAPRRLALHISSVSASQATQTEIRRGPSLAAAFDQQQQPTPAATGFARSCGVDVADLQELHTDAGSWLSCELSVAGQTLEQLLQGVLPQCLKRLPIPKRMRWGEGEDEFVRPVHWFVALFGRDLLDLELFGIQAQNFSRGHRFHANRKIEIPHADEYLGKLRDAYVDACFETRRDAINKQLETLAASINGHLQEDAELLDEVTSLVEHPNALIGSFDESFLEVPAECLISSMRDHQKYFHLRDSRGQLLPNFITVSNVASKHPEWVIAGNQRVLRARLADAEFFWQQDKSIRLEQRLPQLDEVRQHVKLGSIGDKVRRLITLVGKFAPLLSADTDTVERAASLCKADLLTHMVAEFDSLQGVMGQYYARLDGESDEVSDAIRQHYLPRFAGDELPDNVIAQTLAIADRMDNLVGIIAVEGAPSGDKDPYGMRRAALSLLRILIEKEHSLELAPLIDLSIENYHHHGITLDDKIDTKSLQVFITERLVAYFRSQDVHQKVINAVKATATDSPLDFAERIRAVTAFLQLEAAKQLAAANKRIGNILRKVSFADDSGVDEALLQVEAEQQLYAHLEKLQPLVEKQFSQRNYQQGLELLAQLRQPIDDFFDDVMVMEENVALQKNRLCLLSRIRQLFLSVADISTL